MVGILYYPPERDPSSPDPCRSWLTPEQPIFTTTDKPVETPADVRPALRGLGFVPDDADYELELLRTLDGQWTREEDASKSNVVAYMRPTREIVQAPLGGDLHPRTITVRLLCSCGRACSDVVDDGCAMS